MQTDLPPSPYYGKRVFANYRDHRTTVSWMASTACNFRCVYCFPVPHPRHKHTTDEFVEALRPLAPLRLVLDGGEPLLQPEVFEVSRRVGTEFPDSRVVLTSNFSVNAKKFVDEMSPTFVEWLRLTYHPQERNDRYTFDEFAENIRYALSKGYHLDVLFVDYPELEGRLVEDCKRLYEATGVVPLQKRFLGEWRGQQYPGDTVNYYGKRCVAGQKFIALWEDGNITRCQADQRSLGNIFTGYKLQEEPTVCRMTECGCFGRECVVDRTWDEYYGRYFGEDG